MTIARTTMIEQELNMATQLIRVQDKGQVTLPRTIREKLHLKKGDLVTFVETEKGIVVQPVQVIIDSALDAIGEELREKGVTLTDLMEQGRKVRGDLLQEFYGIKPARKKRA
jgi:AbrB family looped-hinge helix DNA binding protein